MTHDFSTKVQLVLTHHPALELTAWQRELVGLSHMPERGWQNRLAKKRNVSRQAITNTLRVVRRKVEAAEDFVRLSNGEITAVFEKYSTGWATAPIRTLLWDMLRPKLASSGVDALRAMLAPIQKAILSEAVRTLEMEARQRPRAGSLNSARLSLGYNMLISAAHIQSNRPDLQRLVAQYAPSAAASSWLVYRFLERALHLFDHDACSAHGQWLKEKIAHPDDEAARFAQYALTYYGGTDAVSSRRFLESDGERFPGKYTYTPVLSRLYANMQIPRYDSPLWDDINFLRIVLLSQHLPMHPHTLPPGSKNSLMTLCQQAQGSGDSFVANHAQRMLSQLSKLSFAKAKL